MRRALLALVLVAACGSPDGRVVVAAGTTVVDAGVLDDLAAVYEASHPGVEISIVGDATARVLALGRRGAAAVLITHDPDAEETFVAAAGAARHDLLMTSRFVLVGPASGVAALAGLSPEAAFAAIAGRPFVGRGDGSGTAVAEARLWAAADVDPAGAAWYRQTGLGMGETLQVADQREAFTLAEEGAFRQASGTLGLVAADLADGPLLVNPYHLILVADASPAAAAFADWLLSDDGRDALRRVQITRFGVEVYRAG